MPYISCRIDPNFKLAGITKRPFHHLVPDNRLPNYKIFSIFKDTSQQALSAFNVETEFPKASPRSILGLLTSPGIKKYVHECLLADTKINFMVTNVTPEIEIILRQLGANLIGTPSALREKYEEKSVMRSNPALAALCAPFLITNKETIGRDEYGYDGLKKKFGDFVIQDTSQNRTGGRGTFVVHTSADLKSALPLLKQEGGNRAVISRFISGTPASILCCLTRHGIFHGPLQRQIVGHPALTSPATSQFAGGQWDNSLFTAEMQNQAYQIVRQAAREMERDNYRGLLGIDFILGSDGRACLTEINARPTALSAALNLLHHAQGLPPLSLLHILEHAEQEYEIDDPLAYQQALLQVSPLTYLIVYNLDGSSVMPGLSLPSGIINLSSGTAVPVRASFDLRNLSSGNIIIPNWPAPQKVIRPHRQLLSFFSGDPLLSPDGALNPKGRQILTGIRKLFHPV